MSAIDERKYRVDLRCEHGGDAVYGCGPTLHLARDRAERRYYGGRAGTLCRPRKVDRVQTVSSVADRRYEKITPSHRPCSTRRELACRCEIDRCFFSAEPCQKRL